MSLLIQNLWSQYGFKGNPYDTTALPISKAYVGRSLDLKESQLLTNLLRSPFTIKLPKAKELLRIITIEKIRSTLSDKELDVLLKMVEMEEMEEFSNIDLSKHLGIQKQNIAKYIKKFVNTGYIRFIRQEKRKTIYVLTEDIYYLHNMIKNVETPKPTPKNMSQQQNNSLNLQK